MGTEKKRRRDCSPNAYKTCLYNNKKVANSAIIDNAFMHGMSIVEHYSEGNLEQYRLVHDAFRHAYLLFGPEVADAFTHGVSVQIRRVYG